MPSIPLRRLGLAAALAALAGAVLPAHAQTPPIKTGLWEVKDVGAKGESKQEKRAEQMKNLPPKVREQMEAMLKERGVSVGADGQTRVCLAKQSLDSGAWAKREGCTTDFTDKSASRWKWHTTCADTQIDGVAEFTSAERYAVHVTTTGKRGSHERDLQATWLGADCGGVKPLAPQQRPAH